jgi:ABC-type antimicrobial peptide transport system permease subunit
MGNQVSSTITQDLVTRSFISSVIQSTQEAITDPKIFSNLTIDTEVASRVVGEQRNKCAVDLCKDKSGKSLDKCIANCILLNPNIDVHDIKVGQVMNVSGTVQQISNLSSQQINDISQKIKASIDQKNSGIFNNTKADVSIHDVVDTESRSVIESLQRSIASPEINQNVVIRGTGISGVMINSVVDLVYNNLQNTTQFTDSMNKLTQDIEASVKQSNSIFGGSGAMITGIIIGMVVFFILLFVLITLLKMKKSDRQGVKALETPQK